MTDLHPTCPACGSTDYSKRFIIDTFPLLQCKRCSLELLHPQPSNEILGAIYNKEYQLAANSELENSTLDGMKEMTARLYLETLNKLDLPNNPKLLEIGCGWGHFIGEAARTGYDAYGVEISSHAARQAASRLSPERIINSTIEDSGLQNNSFDLCVMIDVIEHVRAPQQFLSTVGQLLKPGGHLFIVTPSTNSLSAKLMGRYWMEYKTEHLYSFSKKSMAQLLIRNNYTAIQFKPAKKALNFNFIRAYFERFRVPGLTQILSLIGKILPQAMAFKQIVIPAGGMITIARKQVTQKDS